MALSTDDLQRLRDAIAKGWDFTHTHEIDFAAAVTELLDDALEDSRIDPKELAGEVLDCFPSVDGLNELRSGFENAINDSEEDEMYAAVEKCIVGLVSYIESYEKAQRRAEGLL